MNRLDRFLSTLPEAHNGWHCPWFVVIMILGLNGVIFGLVSFFQNDSWAGLVAFIVGVVVTGYSFYLRLRRGPTC